jgi:hypothetical protein
MMVSLVDVTYKLRAVYSIRAAMLLDLNFCRSLTLGSIQVTFALGNIEDVSGDIWPD